MVIFRVLQPHRFCNAGLIVKDTRQAKPEMRSSREAWLCVTRSTHRNRQQWVSDSYPVTRIGDLLKLHHKLVETVGQGFQEQANASGHKKLQRAMLMSVIPRKRKPFKHACTNTHARTHARTHICRCPHTSTQNPMSTLIQKYCGRNKRGRTLHKATKTQATCQDHGPSVVLCIAHAWPAASVLQLSMQKTRSGFLFLWAEFFCCVRLSNALECYNGQVTLSG